jgi:biotin carboxyl carrier protein
MPNYEVQVDGKLHKIELVKVTQTTFTAEIDDKSCRIEVETDKLDPDQAFIIRINDKKYKIELPKFEQGKTLLVKIEEATFKIEAKAFMRKQILTSFEPTPQTSTRKTMPRHVAVEGAVAAPMTGKIVSVKVKKGDVVKANQVLCIIEAMKMENEIATPKAGTVQDVNVRDGQPVNEGETLLVIA